MSVTLNANTLVVCCAVLAQYPRSARWLLDLGRNGLDLAFFLCLTRIYGIPTVPAPCGG